MKKNGSFMKIMMPLIDKLSPACDVITRKISESMDHPISFRDRFRIRFHILFCAFCNRYRRQLLAIRNMLDRNRGRLEDEDTTDTPVLSPEAKERIKHSLRKPEEN